LCAVALAFRERVLGVLDQERYAINTRPHILINHWTACLGARIAFYAHRGANAGLAQVLCTRTRRPPGFVLVHVGVPQRVARLGPRIGLLADTLAFRGVEVVIFCPHILVPLPLPEGY